MPICIQCRKEKQESNIEIVDGEYICHNCLYNNHHPYEIYPIGFVENKLTRGTGFGVKGQRSGISKINLFESQRPFIYKLEEEKYICILFLFHKQRSIRSSFHRGLDGKKVGIFASRTPDRLSRIGVSNVELEKVEGTTLYVKYFDAIDGTPVLDIKLGQKARW
jgi:tRNA (Thr-GGU) A37 N-methylase